MGCYRVPAPRLAVVLLVFRSLLFPTALETVAGIFAAELGRQMVGAVNSRIA